MPWERYKRAVRYSAMASDCGRGVLYETDEASYEASPSTESSFSELDQSTPTRSVLPPRAPNPPDMEPYRRPHPYFPSFERVTPHTWFEQTDSKIQALVDSQKKMMVMFEKVSDGINLMEKVISSSSQSTSDEKTRVPPQLSVCN